MATVTELERNIRPLTRRINGQYPRPWYTDQSDPTVCRVFLIGRNWGVPFYVKDIGTHKRFIDAHFNRNGESCAELYDEVTKHSPTRTKQEYQPVLDALADRGIYDTLETNVICYGTAGSSNVLSKPEHSGGKERGIEIFKAAVEAVAPPVLICYGTGTAKEFAKIWQCDVLLPVRERHQPKPVQLPVSGYRPTVFIIPSLGAPEVNKWSTWRPAYLQSLARLVKNQLT